MYHMMSCVCLPVCKIHEEKGLNTTMQKSDKIATLQKKVKSQSERIVHIPRGCICFEVAIGALILLAGQCQVLAIDPAVRLC